jgi:hypothetical protein
MKVLVQQQIWIAHEFLTVNREQNPVRPSRRTHAQMNPRISRVLDDDNSTDGLSEYLLERQRHWWRQHITAADQHGFITAILQWAGRFVPLTFVCGLARPLLPECQVRKRRA